MPKGSTGSHVFGCMAALPGMLLAAGLLPTHALGQAKLNAGLGQNVILYGAAYYEEYAPYDRLTADVQMMKSAGINVVRIGESTWGTLEPHDGVFDYSHID